MADEVNSPMWWLRRLHAEILQRRRAIEKATAYYDGAHNLAFAGEKFLEAFGGMFHAFADNWCGVVVDAVEERLNVEGFRVDPKGGADAAAWAIWQRNEMDAQSQLGHQEALIGGAAYAVVWPDGDDKAEITVESAANTIVEYHPKFRRQRRAGLRLWMDDWGFEHAELILADDVYLFRSKGKRTDVADAARSQWIPDPAESEKIDDIGRMANELGEVSIIELMNRPRLRVARRVQWAAHSEIASIIPLQDGINKMIADMLVASEFAAFKQRILIGYEGERDENGVEQPPNWKPGPGRVNWVADDKIKVETFDAADLSNFTTAIELLVQHVASISRTPPHYLNASADRLSGESIKAAETGLVAKTRRKMRPFGEAWEDVMRLSGKIEKNAALTEATAMETIWADPETRTEAEHIDAVTKRKALNVPDEQLWEDAGYTPGQVARFPAMRARQALVSAIVPPAQPAPVPDAVGG